MEKLFVIKIGGNIIDDETKLSSFLKAFGSVEGKKILVHGGGKLATKVAEAMDIPQQLIDGRRITDEATLRVITMVYAGFINKNIVAKLQGENCSAIGFCGADGNLISAHKRGTDSGVGTTGVDYGFVGDIDAVNAGLIQNILQQQMSLVIAPLTHNGKGLLLNTNADTIAQEIAKAMCSYYEVSLIYCFEKNGVLQNMEDDNSAIEKIDPNNFEGLKNNKIISAGMIPKVQNAFDALEAGVQYITIGNAEKLAALVNNTAGTRIVYE